MKTDHITGGSRATHAPKRLGNGRGNGLGKTCGRGHGGSGQRSGYSTKPGFEGGQMPLYRKLPKRGFNNANFRTEYSIVNVGDLSRVEGAVIDKESLVKAGLVRPNAGLIKILGDGELGSAVKVKVDKVSKSAAEKIQAVGGEVIQEAPLEEATGEPAVEEPAVAESTVEVVEEDTSAEESEAESVKEEEPAVESVEESLVEASAKVEQDSPTEEESASEDVQKIHAEGETEETAEENSEEESQGDDARD